MVANVQPRLVGMLKAAADSLRLDILRVLSRDSFGVQELAHIFAIPQPLMSHHLKVLATAGLLVTRREGNSIFYRRALLKNGEKLNAMQSSLFATLDAHELSDEYGKRINAIYKERSLQSREFFEKNAARFEEHQALLCEPGQYFANLKELLDLMNLPKESRVMEVGPGQGELLEELAKRYAKLVALDSSGEMLALTQGKLSGKKIEFVNSSLEAYAFSGAPFGAVILNMVMHHMSSPARAFQKLGQLVKQDGFVLVADLCPHKEEWTKKSCGDLWLGLDPQDLNDWAEEAGLKELQSSYLGLKNGFQIQLKLFGKN